MLSPSTMVSPREYEIICWLGQGLTYAQVADKLVISRTTVKKHLENVRTKFGARSSLQVVWILLAPSTEPPGASSPVTSHNDSPLGG